MGLVCLVEPNCLGIQQVGWQINTIPLWQGQSMKLLHGGQSRRKTSLPNSTEQGVSYGDTWNILKWWETMEGQWTRALGHLDLMLGRVSWFHYVSLITHPSWWCSLPAVPTLLHIVPWLAGHNVVPPHPGLPKWNSWSHETPMRLHFED